MMTTEIKALTFDVFGTVVDWRGSILAELNALGRAQGISENWDAFVEQWRQGFRQGQADVRAGKLPWTNMASIHRKKLDELLVEYGIHNLTEEEITRLNTAWYRLKPWQDTIPGLTRLKKKYILATLSNGDMPGLVNLSKFAVLPWDCIFSVDMFKHFKPARATYIGACELLGLPPEQVMMVAAHNYDLKAAQSFRMKTGFVLRAHEFGPQQTVDLKPEGEWDVVVQDLEELAAVMGT
ncbi:MAG: haloacid dehalogenase type II [Chloroflexi bacterium]|nr:haloacid dehalogenase type II [Chloroflexota bacterium]